MSKTDVIAILCADIHLTLNPPMWRSAEPDWLEAQKRPLLELQSLQDKYECPVICAGDVFDKWNSPPELINFALDYLPNMITVPGQHDLPLHNLDNIKKSAFWTLIEAHKITWLNNTQEYSKGLWVRGFPFGVKVTPQPNKLKEELNIALIHQYVWTKGANYQTASPDCHIKKQKDILQTYDVCVFGDNHIGFNTKLKNTQIHNCGSLMRRHSDQINYKPRVGLLQTDGQIVLHYLDISKDKYIRTTKKDDNINESSDMAEFFEELESLGQTSLDFKEYIKQWMQDNKKTKKQVKEIIIKAMENG